MKKQLWTTITICRTLNFFWIPTPLTLEKFKQPQWPSTQPTEDQFCMILDVFCNIDFYFDDKSRYLIVSFGNAIMYESTYTIYINISVHKINKNISKLEFSCTKQFIQEICLRVTDISRIETNLFFSKKIRYDVNRK